MQVKPTTRRARFPWSSSRWGLAVTVAGTVFAASYALQRLFVLFVEGEPTPTTVVLDGWTPYYWRCALALVHAVTVVPMVGLAVDDDRAVSILRWAPLWMPAVVLPLALLMVGFP